MNQDRVKEILLEIEESGLEFSVIFTGKTSKKVNGLYKSDTHEIILHNKNFSADNELLYTAIHEYTHHRICEQDGRIYTSRVHTQRFWSAFHRLLQKAEEKGLYKLTLEESPELLELTDTIRTTIMTEDGKLMKELGRLLGKARALCKQAGVRYEDYIDRVLCLPRASAATMEKMHAFDVKPELGYEAMKVVATISNPDKRNAAEELFLQKNSPAFVRDSIRTQKPEEDPRRKLENEKRRIERTIASLQARLSELEETLAHIPAAPLVFCFLFFLYTLAPVTAEQRGTGGHIPIPAVPAIPDIPQVTGGNGLQPPAPPQITPPVFQPAPYQSASSSGRSTSSAGKSTAKQPKPVNGLNARTLSALTQGSSMMLLENLIGGADSTGTDSGGAVLTKILSELEKLQTKAADTSNGSSAHKTAGRDDIESSTSEGSSSVTVKEPGAELLRLRINGREIKEDMIYTICSRIAPDGTFLYGFDRRFTANGAVLNETVYFLCRKAESGFYEISMDLRQDPLNPNSFLHKLYELSPLSVSLTSDLIFWHYKASGLEVELVFRIPV